LGVSNNQEFGVNNSLEAIRVMEWYMLGGEAAYTEYLNSIYSLDGMNNNFNTEIEVTADDKVLTLATCISNKPTNRYLVQGVLVAEGTQE